MTEAEGRREIEYQMSMSLARKLLEDGAITPSEYDVFNEEMMGKYTPVLGAMFSTIDLLKCG